MKKIISIGNYADVRTKDNGCLQVTTGVSKSVEGDDKVVVYVEDGIMYLEYNESIRYAASLFKVIVTGEK